MTTDTKDTQDKNPAQILGRIAVQGTLRLTTPLFIGEGVSGEERSNRDIHVLRGKDGVPFIPGTSLAGALRSFIETDEPRAAQLLFGTERDAMPEDERQSAVVLYDVELKDAVLGVRDGVHIDNVTGTAVNGHKYDYEIVESGASGSFYVEVVLRVAHEKDEETLKRALSHLRDLLRSGFQVGALTTKGFGRMYLRNMTVDCYDFRIRDDVIAWLAPERGNAVSHMEYSDEDRPPASPASGDFVITADFALTGALIVRDYESASAGTEDGKNPDALMKTNAAGEPIIPGTSIKGVLRHRAAYILHVLKAQEERAEQLLGELMGLSPAQMRACGQSEKKRSRFIVDEAVMKAEPYNQTRIRCDRFTGGTIGSALFSTQPVRQEKGIRAVTLTFGVKGMGEHCVQDWEAGLCLLLLKELWLGRIAVGGEKSIGRGRFEGLHAVIHDRGQRYELTQGQRFDADMMQRLQAYATALREEATK